MAIFLAIRGLVRFATCTIHVAGVSAGPIPGWLVPVCRYYGLRLYNDRPDVNHRYTASLTIRQQMIDAGWIPEGYGSTAVGMCVIAF